MEDFNLYRNLENELVSDQSKNAIIQKVFENRTKSMLQGKITDFFPDGGGVGAKKIYTPYEFLYELLPQVYGRNYVVSDTEGKEMQESIETRTEQLNADERQVVLNSNAFSIYDENVSTEDRNRIEVERRKLESDKIFITESELQAYLIANPDLNREDYTKNDALPLNYYVDSGLLFVELGKSITVRDNDDNFTTTYTPKYIYKYDYLSGNVAEKIKKLSQNKELYLSSNLLTEEQVERQKNLLQQNRAKNIRITDNPKNCLVVTPYSKFAKRYYLTKDDFVEGESDFMTAEMKLKEAFSLWVSSEMDSALLNDVPSRSSVVEYFCNYATISKKATENEKSSFADIREKTFRNGKLMMVKFLNLLTDDAKLRLELEWNGKYNFYKEPKYEKFPVACSLSSVFKDGSPFTPNESQVQSMQFMKSVGSGLLAFGVGVGKTASAIMNLSYWLGSNQTNRPILVVPNAVYEKWKVEMFGGESKTYEVTFLENNFETSITFDDLKKAKVFKKEVNGNIVEKTRIIEGHIPQWSNYIELGNLSYEYVTKIKNYTEDELLQMENGRFLSTYIKSVPTSYNFDDDVINNTITQKYKDWTLAVFEQDYSNYIMVQKVDFATKENISVYQLELRFEQNEDYRNQFFEKIESKYVFFSEKLKTYNKELPYVLGTLKEFDNKTIFIATYEGLKHLGLNQDTDYSDSISSNSLFGQIHKEISQKGKFDSDRWLKASTLDGKYYTSVFGEINDKISLKEFNFDCAIFDESHFIKNNYTETLGDYNTATRREKRYQVGSGKKPSALALSGYFLSRFIGLNNGDKNVMHLTATPFTNSPNEIYGMLALTNYSFLKQYGFDNLTDFYDIFMDVSYDLVFSPSGVERKEQLVGFQNLPALRSMIYAIMNYKSGEDANIKRPNKYLIPNYPTDERSILPETKEQDILFKKIKDYMRSVISYEDLCGDAETIVDIDEMTEEELIDVVLEKGTELQQEKYTNIERPIEDEEVFFSLKKIVEKILKKTVEIDENTLVANEKDGFRVMKGLNLLKNVTLSPYLSKCAKEGNVEPTAQQYVESSPKILYSVNSIKSIHDWERANNKQLSGCVIYMNIGINVKDKNFSWSESGLEKIRLYLVNNLGYSYDDISIVSGKVRNAEREKQKNRFLNGNSIIMLGSSAISTGVDLQNNASTLFLCDFDWNPTTSEQIAGRIHRQGNRFANVRIVYPMIRNSFDPAVFQKLYEKTLRIKNLWDRNDTGSVLNVKEFDLKELRKNILDEPEDLANFEIEEKVIEINSQINLRENRIEELQKVKGYVKILEEYENVIRAYIVVFSAYSEFLKWEKKQSELQYKLADLQEEQRNSTDEKEIRKNGQEQITVTQELMNHNNSPKYTIKEYAELGTDVELVDNLNRVILNSNSLISRMSLEERRRVYYGWLRDNFSRFKDGKFNMSVNEEDDISFSADFDDPNHSGTVEKHSIEYRDAFRKFNKMKDLLDILGVSLENVDDTIQVLREQKDDLERQAKEVKDTFDTVFEEYVIRKQERQITQMTLEEKVNEFANLNYLLEEQLRTFQQDEARVVVSPVQMLNIEPSVEEAEIVEREIKKKQVKPTSAKPKKARIVGRLKKGLVVRFEFSQVDIEDGVGFEVDYETDLFFDSETEEFILFTLRKSEAGEEEKEEVFDETQAVSYYDAMKEKIVDEFYEKGDVEEVDEEIEVPVSDELFNINLPDGFYVKINPFYTATVRNLNSFKTHLEREDEIFGEEFGEIVYVDNTASKEWVDSLNKLINDKKSKISQQTTISESDEITIEFLQEQINGLLIVKEVTDDLETLQLIDEQINGLNIIIDLKNQEND